ncbi:MAG: phosphoribosyl-ATP pyrophosphohydrolase [halophilic archaeon J07HX5]|jgi:phosphoribosyl-ATP pyrophosphatase (EC 3.6.1.31)|nr:MAG: phosphoribosyl-ATP pyrophosphohydrolase [halophilic archaeon J07HX5]
MDTDTNADTDTTETETARGETGSEDNEIDAVIDNLFAVVEDRKQRLPEDSYTAELLTHEKGDNAVLEKLGEETTEFLLAAKGEDPDRMTSEAADVVYHLLVALVANEITAAQLRAELAERAEHQ